MTYTKEINGKRVFFSGVLQVGDKQIINPTREQIIAAGWQEYVTPQSEPYKPTYEELVEQYIREKYSLSQELAIQRQRDVKVDEFAAYYEYCEKCKQRAKDEISE